MTDWRCILPGSTIQLTLYDHLAKKPIKRWILRPNEGLYEDRGVFRVKERYEHTNPLILVKRSSIAFLLSPRRILILQSHGRQRVVQTFYRFPKWTPRQASDVPCKGYLWMGSEQGIKFESLNWWGSPHTIP